MKNSTDKIIDIKESEYADLISKLESNTLSQHDRVYLVLILKSFLFVKHLLQNQKITIQRLKNLFFGKKTEKDPPPEPKTKQPKPENPDQSEKGSSEPLDDEKAHDASLSTQDDIKSTEEKKLDALDLSGPEDTQASGHGRIPSDDHINANSITHDHKHLKPGEICPKCQQGKLYPYYQPGVFTRIVGCAPLQIEVHKAKRLRCGTCGELFTAPLPQDVQDFPVSTPEANAVAAITKYQAGTPFNRFSNVLDSYGSSIPTTRLYEMTKCVATALQPVFEKLCEWAAQGEVFHNDDTKIIILSLLKENKKSKKEGNPQERSGMFTTSIVSHVGEHVIALYFAGRKHAGENLADILDKRAIDVPPPTQVSDRLSANRPKDHLVDDGACLDHLRRKFYEIKQFYPESCAYVLRELRTIYRADKIAKKMKLSSSERLRLHQEISFPTFERLLQWGQNELDTRQVEKNNPLGKAIEYLIKHFKELTLFTRKEGVPLSNAICEQSLKSIIAIRKMSYFFKTVAGAENGCIILSFIQTCFYCHENVYEYFIALQKNERDVKNNPDQWFPWNFRQRLVALALRKAS